MFQLLGSVFLAAFSIPLVVYDLRERRLPNKITLPAIGFTLLGVSLAGDLSRFLIALGCAIGIFALGLLASFRNWLGMGDVKLLVSISLILGWYGPSQLALGLGIAFVLAGVVVIFRLFLKKITASSTIALGPYLLGGFWVCLTPLAWSSIAH